MDRLGPSPKLSHSIDANIPNSKTLAVPTIPADSQPV